MTGEYLDFKGYFVLQTARQRWSSAIAGNPVPLYTSASTFFNQTELTDVGVNVVLPPNSTEVCADHSKALSTEVHLPSLMME